MAGAEAVLSVVWQVWSGSMGGTGKSSKKKEDKEEELASPEKQMSRRQVVGYGYQDTHTAREQLWGKYKVPYRPATGGGEGVSTRCPRVPALTSQSHSLRPCHGKYKVP